MRNVSKRLKSQINQLKQKKVIQLSDIYTAKQQLKNDINTIKGLEDLKEYHPIHAVYISTQNLVSYLAENLSVLPELKEYYNIIESTEEEYVPEGPPFSPLTTSYYTMWAFFDLTFGKDKETIGTCLIDIGPELRISDEYIEIIKLMQESRMGIYEHAGVKDDIVYLKELILNKQHYCRVPAGYKGKEGELWFVRVLPAPFDVSDESLVFITPYIIISPDKNQWYKYLERTLIKTEIKDKNEAYIFLMKYGLDKNYWNEYIFQAYADSTQNAIFLTGIPDLPESLPHSSENY